MYGNIPVAEYPSISVGPGPSHCDLRPGKKLKYSAKPSTQNEQKPLENNKYLHTNTFMSVITSFCPRRSDRSVVQTSKKAHLTYSLEFVYTEYSPCNRLCVSQPVREEKTQIPSATSGPLSCHYVYLLLWRLHGMSIYQDYNQHYHDYHYCHYSFINEYDYIIF